MFPLKTGLVGAETITTVIKSGRLSWYGHTRTGEEIYGDQS